MNLFLKGVAQAVTETFDLPGPVLEVGSYQVTGQKQLANLRSFFPGREYTGIDIRSGPGVDLVASVEELPFEDGEFGCVVAMSTFEHVQRFWRGFDEIYRVLRPDGALLVSCPFNVRIHNHPHDYWRFTPDAMQLLLSDYVHRLVGWHGPQERPENVWGVAFREGHAPITSEQMEQYQSLIKEYARQPIPWKRKLRYRFINLIDRRRLCSPFLEVEHWQTSASP